MGLSFTGVKKDNEFELITPDVYAVELHCEWKKKKNSEEKYINCAFQIIKGLNQNFEGRIVFDAIYKSKKTGAYQQEKIDGLLSTIDNPKLDFDDYDELIFYLNGKQMTVEIDIEEANPEVDGSKDKNIIKYLSYGKVEIREASDESNNQEINNVDNEELPF